MHHGGGTTLIIFGWGGGRPTDHGGAVPATCPNCNNDTVLRYTTTTNLNHLPPPPNPTLPTG